MAVKAKQQYYADETTIKKEAREFGMIDELKDKLDSIEYGAQVNIIEEVQENGVPLEIVDKSVNVLVPEVIDNLYTIDPNNSLSAKQGKILYDMIKNLLARGRFLSTWNTATGLPVTNPEESPYEYKAGDYYIVGIVAAEGGTNFRPEPGEYVINVASDEQETSEVHVSDIYVYDGENWILLINSTREIAVDDYVDHTYQSTNPVENQAIAREIDTKQNKFYTVSTTSPSNPAEGDEWYDATNDKVFYWDGTQWKEMGGGSTYTAGLHISIDPNDNNKISVVEWSATSSALGLVKLGSDIRQTITPNNVSDTVGRTYKIQTNSNGQLMVNVPWTDTNTTYTGGDGINISNQNVISCTVKPVTVGPTAPATPGTGDLWYDTTKNTMFLYKNNAWTIIGPEIYPITKADYEALTPAEQGDGRFFLITDNDGTIYVDWDNVQNRPMYIGATAPSNPCEGYIWYDTTNDVLKVYDGTQWNEIGGGGGGCCYTAGNGIDITNDEISIDTTVVATQTDLNSKQDVFHTTSSTQPSNPSEGDEWYDSTNDVLKVYDGTNWIVTGKTYTAGDGIDIDANNEISVDVTDIIGTGLSEDASNNIIVDTTVVATQTDLSGKQDKATSGSGAPSTTPTYVGQVYIDTTNDNLYVATGTSSSSDWTSVDTNTTYTAGFGIDIDPNNNNEISVDTTDLDGFGLSANGGTGVLDVDLDAIDGFGLSVNGGTGLLDVDINSLIDTTNGHLDIDPSTSKVSVDMSDLSYDLAGEYLSQNYSNNKLDVDTSTLTSDLAGFGLNNSYNGSTGKYSLDVDAYDLAGFGLTTDSSGANAVLKVDTYDLAGSYLSQNSSNDKLDVDRNSLVTDIAGFGLNTDSSGAGYTLKVDAYDLAGTGLTTNNNGGLDIYPMGFVDTSKYLTIDNQDKVGVEIDSLGLALAGSSSGLDYDSSNHNLYVDPVDFVDTSNGYLDVDNNGDISVDKDDLGLALAGTGLGYNSGTGAIDIDTTVIQEKLTAGDGIDIDANNEISVDVTDIIGTGLSEDSSNNLIVDSTVVALKSDLTNYYTKTETYTKTEVDNLISSFGNFEVVASLPSVSTASEKTIYLLGPIGTGADKYEEWIVTNQTVPGHFESASEITKVDIDLINVEHFYSGTSVYWALNNLDLGQSNCNAYIFDSVDSTKGFVSDDDPLPYIYTSPSTPDTSTGVDGYISCSDTPSAASIEFYYSSSPITWVEASTQKVWTKIGETSVDLSGYATTTALTNGLATKQDTLTAGDGIDIDANNEISVDSSDLAGTGLSTDANNNLIVDTTVIQGKLTAGTNIDITNDVISADTQFVVVDTLPSISTADENKIYILGPIGTGADRYEEWIKRVVQGQGGGAMFWAKIGETSVDISGKQDKATSGSTAPSTTPSYVGEMYVDTTNDILYVATGTTSSSDWTEVGAGSGDMLYSDFGWDTLTGASVTLALRGEIEPSANFTVNKPNDLKDGQFYVLRVDNGATAYTMTLGTGVTNPYSEDLTLVANNIQQFMFLAKGGNLELQPSTEIDISGKQDKATSGSTAPSITPSYVGQQYVDTTNDILYVATGTSSSSDWTEVGAGSGDMLYQDFNWVTKTGATVTLDINSTITPSANFTVNAPATIKDGQVYILRVINGATAYTMTLGTGITNPYSTSTTLTANGVDQFVFQAIGGNLELLPDTDVDITGKQDKATSSSTAPAITPSYIGQQHVDTTNDKLYVATGTSSSSDWMEVGAGGGNVIAMTQQEYNALTTAEKNDGKLRIITDAPTEDISIEWSNIANRPGDLTAAQIQAGSSTTSGMVAPSVIAASMPILSTQTGALSSVKIWVGTQSAYEALATKDANTLYFTTPSS